MRARSQLGAAVGRDVLWGNGGRYAVCSSWKTGFSLSPSLPLSTPLSPLSLPLFPLSPSFYPPLSPSLSLLFVTQEPPWVCLDRFHPTCPPPPASTSSSSLPSMLQQQQGLSPVPSQHAPPLPPAVKVFCCHYTLLTGYPLATNTPFKAEPSIYLSSPFFYLPSLFVSSLLLSSSFPAQSLGDRFSLQIFAFHEYATAKYPA